MEECIDSDLRVNHVGIARASTPEPFSLNKCKKCLGQDGVREGHFTFARASTPERINVATELEIADLAQYDKHHHEIIRFLQTMQVPTDIPVSKDRHFCIEATKYHIVDGVLFRRNTKGRMSRKVICHKNDKKAILKALLKESGHRGRDGTPKKILETYWWRNVYRDKKEHVQTCDECQHRLNVLVEEVLHPNITSTMWNRVCVDVVHVPKGVGGSKYLVVAREDISGLPEAKAIRKANSQTVAKFLEEEVFARHGCPTMFVVDGGSENKGFVDELCVCLRVEKHTVTPCHPQANGVVERGHKQLVDGLSKLCSASPGKWPNFLGAILWADLTTVRKSTGFTPFQLVYGRQCLLPIELLLSTWQMYYSQQARTPAELLALLVKQLTAHIMDVDEAVATLTRSKLANKAWFDKKKKLRPETANIHKGYHVLLHNTKLDNQHTDKLTDRWGGPYLVHKILDGDAYVLTELDGSRLDGAYVGNRLKRYWARGPAEDEEQSVEETVEEDGDMDTEADSDIDVDADDNVDSNMGKAEIDNSMECGGDVEDMGSEDEGSEDEINEDMETDEDKGRNEDKEKGQCKMVNSEKGFFVLIP